ncbi:MAG TPA: tRNA (adenosine(37)-N6)-dimethylallyltransferase MiaA [Smithellaceae bacterium]|nr:tRNA (adenosine(37)-N6)-dimethylallyltransferase MiaA [Smithellaceae bacterium]
MKKNLIVILGPTASGKTALAVRLAAEFGGEIISADSRQVYRGMDIGTGKDLDAFRMDGRIIPSHLIDILDPDQEFSVFEFQKRFYEIFSVLRKKQVLPLLVGGTGLYVESVLTRYFMPDAEPDARLREELAGLPMEELQGMLLAMKPRLHNQTDLQDRERLIRKIEIERARNNPSNHQIRFPEIHAGVFGIFWERAELKKRISARLFQRLAEGMIEEVSRLHEEGISWERLDRFGLEYRFIARYLQKKTTRDEMTAGLQAAIGQFAKRQMTWFRRMEKRGVPIEWIPGGDYPALRGRVLEMFSREKSFLDR